MEKRRCYFFFAGYYTVAAAAELLIKYHIRSRIVKAPVMVKNSCQFAVLIPEEDVEMAKYVFERENVRVNRIEFTGD